MNRCSARPGTKGDHELETHRGFSSTVYSQPHQMQTPLTNQQKIERLETEKRQLENRIRQLKNAAHTAERKRLTRAKIILGSLVLRNHAEFLS